MSPRPMATLGDIRRHRHYLAKKLVIRWALLGADKRHWATFGDIEWHLATLGKKYAGAWNIYTSPIRNFFGLKTGFSNPHRGWGGGWTGYKIGIFLWATWWMMLNNNTIAWSEFNQLNCFTYRNDGCHNWRACC